METNHIPEGKELDKRSEQAGILAVLLCQLCWGLAPLYWRKIGMLPGIETICYRILGGMLFTLVLLWILCRRKGEKLDLKPKNLGVAAISAVLLALNWLIYIFAVNSGRVQEASFGYFLNPIMLVVMGVVVFKEKLTRNEKIAFGFVILGLVVTTIAKGKISWMAILLPGSFVVYSYVKKKNPMPALQSFVVEMLLLTPIVVAYLIYLYASGKSAVLTAPSYVPWILPIAGVLTGGPMVLYNFGVARMNLVLAGFLQYVSPIIQLLLSIFAFGEPFNLLDAVSFALVWIGILCIATEQFKTLKKKE